MSSLLMPHLRPSQPHLSSRSCHLFHSSTSQWQPPLRPQTSGLRVQECQTLHGVNLCPVRGRVGWWISFSSSFWVDYPKPHSFFEEGPTRLSIRGDVWGPAKPSALSHVTFSPGFSLRSASSASHSPIKCWHIHFCLKICFFGNRR